MLQRNRWDRFFTKVTAVFLLLAVLVTSVPFVPVGMEVEAATSTPYYNWKQTDSQWADKYIGTKTIRAIGCAATSVAMLIVHSGLKSESNFDPGTFVDMMKNIGGFSNNDIYWSKVSSAVPGFSYSKQVNLSGTEAQKISALGEYLQQGYYVVVSVKSGSHWVALRSVTNGRAIMMDPNSTSTDLFSKYSASGVSRIILFTSTGVPQPTTPPTNPKLTIYTKGVAVGETILFEYSVDNATNMYIPIDVDGVREHFIEVSGNHYNATFYKTGRYLAALYATNAYGNSGFSNWVSFLVYDSKPTGAWIWQNKDAVKVGEEISFNYNATNATSFSLGIDKVGVGRVRTIDTESDWYTTTFSEPGIYTIYATCKNSLGYMDSSSITFVVYQDIGTNFYAPILNKGHWKIIENDYVPGTNGNIQTADETGTSNQLWYFEKQSDGSYIIFSCYDGMCLDVKNASSEPEATVWTCAWNGSDAQRWYIWEESGGYVLKPKCSNYVLDLCDNDPTNGTGIQTFIKNNTSAQVWAIYKGSECQFTSPTLSVKAGQSATKTSFTWSNVYGETRYDIKIWKGTANSGEPYHAKNNVTSGYSVQLPAGTYQAYVNAVNYYQCKTSNIVTFTVSDAKYTISYNANGGTGAPGNQTKTHGTDLTLSSTKPTKSYTITYNANGGSVSPASKTVSATFKNWNTKADGSGTSYAAGAKYTPNAAVTLYAQWTNPTAGDLATPTRTGYTFNGWYTAKTGGTKVTSTSTISANTTLYAQWTQIKYTISYNANGGTGAPGNQTKVYGTNLTLSSTKPTKNVTITYDANGGSVSTASKNLTATFKNWNTKADGSGTTYAPSASYSANSAATLYAQWTNPTAGDLATPTRTGYTFNGWYTAKTGGTKVTSTSTISANTTLYAQWTQIKYTISYNANGGTGAPGNQTKVYGTNLTLSSTKPTKSYTITYNANGGSVSPASKTVSATFKSWNTKADGSGTTYAPSASYSANAAATLYAQWTNPAAGDLPTPTWTGYTFDGWYTAKTGGTKVTSSSTISANTTLYAQWTQVTYLVTYNANSGSGAPGNQAKYYGTDLTLSSTKPTKNVTITYDANGGSVSPASKTVSATFKNWNTKSDGSGTTYAPGASYSANAAVTLYAQWTNPTAGDLATPTRTGYTFNGWYTAKTGGTKVTSTSTISANTTLYAQWTQIKYTISYNANGGTGAPGNQTKVYGTNLIISSSKPTKSVTITYNANGGSVSAASKTVSATFKNWNTKADGSGITYAPGGTYAANAAATLYAQWTNPTAGDLPTPTWTGYTFDGWYTAKTGGTKVTSSSTISANTTLYAQWTQVTYLVTYNANSGSGAPGNQAKYYGTDLTLSSTKPTKSYTITYDANGGSVSPASKTVSATFKNWNTKSDGSGTTYAPGGTYTANAAVTLYAQWTNPTAGDLATPTRTGYTFNGWYTAASGGTKVTSASTISADATLYAQWTLRTYSIAYNANGGTGVPGNQSKLHGTALTLSGTVPTKSYTITYDANGGSVSTASKDLSATFNSWNTAADGSGSSYVPGGTYSADAAAILYAQWTNPTAGDLPTPTRPGYTFNGWYTAKTGGTKVTSSSTISASKTLYAQWTQVTTRKTVRLYGNGRCETAAAIAKASFDSADSVVLASGDNYADALAGGSLAYALNAPILLISNGTLDSATLGEIERLGAEDIYILGGTSAVSESIAEALVADGYTVSRIFGNSRFETSVKIAEKLQTISGTPDELFFAYAANYPDALAVSNIAALKGCPVLYIANDGVLDTSVAAFVESCDAEKATILGGTAAISSAAETNIASSGIADVSRIFGSNRFETCLKINENYASVLTGDAICVATGLNFPDALAGGVFAAKNKAPLVLVDKTLSDSQETYINGLDVHTAYIFGGTGAVSSEVEYGIFH